MHGKLLAVDLLKVVLFGLLMLLFGTGWIPADRAFAADKYRVLINCDLHQGDCQQTLGGHKVILMVTPRPVTAMTDLTFRVTFEGAPAMDKPPYIDLGMPGMNMGKNQVQLKSIGNGVYQGRGVIVRCKSGRRTWRASVTCPGIGTTDFIFDVVY